MVDNSQLRTRASLDGPWDFRFGDETRWRTVTVPGPWQAQFDDLRNARGIGHYRRRIALPGGAGEAVLRFGAASEITVVRLDGVEIGRHEGGYLPFDVVLPTAAADEALLEVDTILPSADEDRFPGQSFLERPHGKQSWYGPLGGLWQSVVLERRDPRHIEHVAITTTLATGAVQAVVRLSQAGALTLRATIVGPDGRDMVAATVETSGRDALLDLRVEAAAPWSPDAPALYGLVLELCAGGAPTDRVIERFGFRTIEARDGRLFLNGEPLYLRGALDQDYYPDGICTPPSLEFLEDQLRKAKHLGLNCLRCHIKVPDPRYYEVADRLGMLVWTEIPNIERFTARAGERLRETFEGIFARDGNHPSIVIWTLINEDWGTRLIENPQHRAWLSETYDWAKTLDPTRLVVDNSACHANFHVKTDIDDYHYYRGLPERRAEWDALTADFASRADWTFTGHGDGARRGDEPLIVSEFGVWGLPHPGAMLDADGREPWWMETGPFWGDGAAYPHGIANRFDLLNLGTVFGRFDAFIDAVQWHQFNSLKYQIESMRSYPSIVGYVITELTDVHWEANGLLDLARNPRVFHDRFATINADVVLLPKLERWAYWAGETIRLFLSAAGGSRAIPAGCRLRWRFEGQDGDVALPGVAALAVSDRLPLDLSVPDIASSRQGEIHLSLATAEGREIAANTVTVSLYPRARPSAISVATSDPALSEYLSALGFNTAPAETADVVIARGVDAADIEAIRRGKRYLVLADRTIGSARSLRLDDLPREPPFMRVVDDRLGVPAATHHWFPGVGLAERHGTLWRGDWIGNFSWLRRHRAFAALPGGPLLDLSFDRVVPLHVLTGFQPWEYETRVHAGVVVGWVHKPAAFIAERPFGDGKLIATTFRLMRDPPDVDPVATTLLQALIETTAA